MSVLERLLGKRSQRSKLIGGKTMPVLDPYEDAARLFSSGADDRPWSAPPYLCLRSQGRSADRLSGRPCYLDRIKVQAEHVRSSRTANYIIAVVHSAGLGLPQSFFELRPL